MTNILSKEACTLIGNRDPVLAFDIQLIFSRSKLLFKLVDICHLHSIHQGQPLGAEGRRNCESDKYDRLQIPQYTDVIQKLLPRLKSFRFLQHHYNKISIDMLSLFSLIGTF